MINKKFSKPSNLEESKEEKTDISKETEITVDDAKNLNLPESNAQDVRVLQNSKAHTGKYELLDGSIVFNTIISLYVAYWTLLFSFFDKLANLFFLNRWFFFKATCVVFVWER